ncbi:MAG: hypothetical protein A2491_07120 [Bacteroidetes bacterium RIFOXYC12_FULL_35_7]|nr:MAG: hypothetical protein A2491_07120 [Bacteroidetes bacterium RIFOXYC12_FULL_35_7]
MIFTFKNSLKISVIVLGITLIITQIIIIREFLSVFNGNELVTGILFANWMLLTALGAYVGKFIKPDGNRKYKLLFILQFVLVLLPFVLVFFLRIFKNEFFPVGSMLGLSEIFFYSFFLLLPFCFISGMLFTFFCTIFHDLYAENKIRQVYALESVGSFAGGLLFNFILLFYFHSFHSLALLLTLNLLTLAFIIFLIPSEKIKISLAAKIALLLIFAVIISGSLAFDFNSKSMARLYPDQKIHLHKETPLGTIVITDTYGQYNFFGNGSLYFSTGNTTESEESVHYALLQHPAPKNILLISGGVSGALTEILKYKDVQIDYLEFDPWLLENGKKFTPELTNKKVNIITEDPARFLKTTNKKYDAVLINVPAPSNLALNRFYTLEFFEKIYNVMDEKAVASIALSPSENYVNEAAAEMYSILFNTLKKVFKNVLIFPGGKNYFLASDAPLSLDIFDHLDSFKIQTNYVNSYYIDEPGLIRKSEMIHSAIQKEAAINTDFKPIAYQKQINYWLSYFKNHAGLLFAIAVILFVLLIWILIRMKSITLALFTTGFTGLSIEIILIMTFQIIYGYAFWMTGVIITAFMAGLAIGAWSAPIFF